MRTIMIAALAAVVIAGGALVATAVAGGQATAQESDESAPKHDRPRRGAILQETLDELVDDGTITQAQADAITDALAAKAEEYRDEIREWREQHRDAIRDGRRRAFRLGTYLDDGVIDSDELAEILDQVPDEHWLKDPDGPAAPYLEDDQVTADELRQLHDQLREQRHAEKSDASAAPGGPTSAQI